MNDLPIDANLAAIGNKAIFSGVGTTLLSNFLGLDAVSIVGIVVAVLGLILTGAAKVHEIYTRNIETKMKKELHAKEMAIADAELAKLKS